jgi:hypothetical protein
MPRFRISVCDGDECEELTANDAESAKRKLTKAIRKRARRFAKDRIPDGHVHGEVREVNRGILADDPLYVADESFGAPRARKRRRRAPPPTE